MNATMTAGRTSPFATLRRLARPRAEAERCEFCSLALGPGHRHLLELSTRKTVCACDGCALRFENVLGRYKLIPRDARLLSGFQITDIEWNSFSLPIELAFFFHSTPTGAIRAMYPSPAGATESLLSITGWSSLVEKNPVLARMEPDVEALLANRLKGSREYYLAPIDRCFELAGLIRLHWRGFTGGDKVWETLDAFFSNLRQGCATDPASRDSLSSPKPQAGMDDQDHSNTCRVSK
jgi:hypothetical protein